VFTDVQWARLQGAFPDGVCDWDQRGVGQRHVRSPLTFEDGPGGKPLARTPTSREHESFHGRGHDDGHDGDVHDRD
jgi:hypothetical protein